MDHLLEVKGELVRARYALLGLKADLKFVRFVRAATKAGFSPDQPRDEEGRWTDGGAFSASLDSQDSPNLVQATLAEQISLPLGEVLNDADPDSDPDPIIPGARYAANVIRNDRTGNTLIDSTTDRLVATLGVVSDTVDQGSGPLYGIAVHTEFARSVRAQNLPGIGSNGVEQSFSLTDVARYGLDGTIRTDVVIRDPNNDSQTPIAVWDVKTGDARLGGSRVKEIRRYLGVGAEVPVIELHVERGVSNKQLKSVGRTKLKVSIWTGCQLSGGLLRKC